MRVRARAARVQAQAKVNLYLHVGERDATGYHPLETLFHRLDLADDVVIRTGGGERALTCLGPRMPRDGIGPVEKNLAYRAAVAYADETGWPDGFAIELTKHIPVGGGLGGGSSDAGAVLRALDVLNDRPIGEGALTELGASLGADVAFLASERVASFGFGRGDRLGPAQPLQPALPSRDVVIVIPTFSIATADAYRWLDEAQRPVRQIAAAALSVPQWSWDRAEALLHDTTNDFEPVVEARHPELRMYRERLTQAGAQLARLAGSGSSVFGIFAGPAPRALDLGDDASIVLTRTSSRVVQVEAQE